MKQLLLFVMTLLPIMVNANDLSDNGIYYKIKSDGSLEVMGSSTANVDIPSSITISGTKYRVTSIGAYAFEGRSDITYLSIPYSIKSIGEYAFMGCGSSMTVNIADPESWCNMQLGNEHASPLSSAGKMLVHDIETDRIDIPEEVTSIGAFTFYQCSCLKSLSIPGSVTSIGSSAFEDCDYLTSLTLNEGLQSIGGSAFEGCKRLANLVLPSTVNSILINAFKNCVGLTDVYCSAANVPNTDASAFSGVATENVALHVPDNAVNAYKSTWPWSNFKGNIDMSKSRTIHVGVAGTLSNYIPTGEIQYVEELTLTGYLNGTDIGFIRRMAGAPLNYSMADEVYEEAERGQIYGKLAVLDISDATIVSGGDSYYNEWWDVDDGTDQQDFIKETYSTSDNTISEYMFRDCKFTKVSLPKNLMEIGPSAFSNCESLTSIDIPQSVISIGSYAFSGCSGLTSVTIPNSVTSIGSSAFSDTGWYNNQANGLLYLDKWLLGYKGDKPVGEIKIAEDTKGIADDAFFSCRGLTSVTIPNCVTSIGSSAFSSCSGLTSVTIPNSVTSIGGYSFSYCSGLTSVTIPNSVTSIGSSAFSGCSGLTSVTIPNSVTSIGGYSFSYCRGLTSVTIPNSVTSIGYMAFFNCSGLTSVTIPNSVKSIGGYAFNGCSGLTSVTSLIRTPISLNGNIFSNYNIPLYVPSESVEAYKATEPWSNFSSILAIDSTPSQNVGDTFKAQTKEGVWMTFKITNLEPKTCQVGDGENASIDVATVGKVTIPETANDFKVTVIGSKGFFNCSKLTAIYLSNNIESIGDSAFDVCSGLTSLIIPNSVTSIGKFAFSDCTGLTSVTIPNSMTEIGDFAFYHCSGLTSVTIPNSVTSIGEHAFSGCSGLPSVTIPNSVTSIGVYAFSSCSGLTSVTIPNSVTSIHFGIFSYCSNLATITVDAGNTVYISPDGSNAIIETTSNKLVAGCKNTTIPNSVTSIGDGAFFGCRGLTSITIPNSVTSIGQSAFSICSNLASVTIPNSVTSIESSAFVWCSGLTSVTIPNSVTSIGDYAFYDCDGLTSVTSLISTPISLNENTFSNYNIPLYVPSESVEAYKATEPWSNFSSILAIDSTPSQNVGDTFKAQTKEGVWMTFKITSLEPKTCQVGDGENASIDVATVGKVTIPETANGFKVTAIGSKGFYNCSKLTAIYLSENIESIGDQAFYGCTSLTVLDIPRSVKVISNTAFDNCGGSSGITINVSADNTSVIPNNNKVKVNITKPTEETTISLERVFIPKSVKNIGERSFSYCKSVIRMEVEEGHTIFDSRENCNAIIGTATNTLLFGCQNTVIPETVTSIGAYAFEGHSNLKTITIPSGISSIGVNAFGSCEGLTNVISEIESPFAINDNTFDAQTYETAQLTVPCGTKEKYQNAAGWKNFINIVETDSEPGSVKTVDIAKAGTLANYISDSEKYTLTELKVTGYLNSTDFKLLRDMAGNNYLGEETAGKLLKLDLDGATIVKGGENYLEAQWVYYTSGYGTSTSGNALAIENDNELGKDVFKGCKLQEVILPSSLTSIARSAFSYCLQLTNVTLSEGLLSIGDAVFLECEALSTLTIPNSVKTLGRYAFAYCNSLTSMTIPDGITTLEDYLFYDCRGLSSVVIPASVTSLKDQVFELCSSLTGVTVYRSAPPSTGYQSFTTQANATLYVPKSSIDAYKAVEPWNEFKEILPIEEDSESVLTYVFDTDNKTAAVTGITEGYTGAVIIPSNVIHDGESYIVSEIDEDAFWDCTGLTSVTIPNSVTYIDDFAFFGCSGLTSVTIPNSVTYIGRSFEGCSGLTSVTIPNSVTSIGENAFFGCSNLTSVTIPNSVTYIGSGAFADCSNLATITVDAGNTVYNSPNGCNAIIKTTSNRLVAGCKNTTIPNSVTSIGDDAFYGCSGLTSVTIPNSVTSIGVFAFAGCSGLTSVTIPNSVTYIGSGVFAGCSNLATITVDAGNTIYNSPDGSNAIIETTSNTLVAGCKNTTIPNSVTSIGANAFLNCNGLTSVTIPNNVTSIGFRAFAYCSDLTSVTIPNSVTSIGQGAFEDCSSLTSVTIPNSVRSIDKFAFWYCDGLTSVTSLISTPISMNESTFSNYDIPLYVPSESVEAYRAMKPWNEFKEIIPIYLTPIEKEVDYSSESSTVDENTDLCGSVIDNVYYNISSDNGGFDADEKCLVVNKAMSDEEIEEVFGKDLFSDDVKENFTGIVIMAPAGKGKVAISAQTTGGMTLMVKVGAADPIEMELEGKLKMKYPYDVSEPTYVYIYAGQNAAARTRAAEEPSLKIYGISLEMEILKGDANGDGVVNDADLKDVSSHIMGMTPKGFNKDAADVNNDNKVNAADIVLINKIINKK